jgi:hypothetical protein
MKLIATRTLRLGTRRHAEGEEFELPDKLARRFIQAGHATEAGAKKAAKSAKEAVDEPVRETAPATARETARETAKETAKETAVETEHVESSKRSSTSKYPTRRMTSRSD